MLITCWSTKGGSGTTVVAAALAILAAAEAASALLVDLAGDLPAALGLPEPSIGLSDWDGGAHALARFEVAAGPGVRLLPRGHGPFGAGPGQSLGRVLAGRGPVVVDAGVVMGGRGAAAASPAHALAAAAGLSLLVIRPCFLALRLAVTAPIRPNGVVLVEEQHRSLGHRDIEAALGLPIMAVVPWDAAVARRVDAGLLGSGLPKSLARALSNVLSVRGTV